MFGLIGQVQHIPDLSFILVTLKRMRKSSKLLRKGSKRKMNQKIEKEQLALIEGIN